jgi:citrate lyase subunit beta/citryl-CoA lyase
MSDQFVRSMLFVPASRPERIEKAAQSAADAVCIDLEDSLPDEEKAAGRKNVVRALQHVDFGARVRIVRINALDTPHTYRDLVDVVEAAGDRLDLVMVPKAESPRDVAFVDTMLSQIERTRGVQTRIGIEAQIETARGFLYVREIARASPRLDALIFGPGDYAASMHMPATGIGEFDAWDELYPGHRWHAAMHTVVAAARANGLRCMDGPYAAFKDAAGLERSSKIARALGFDGKQCIHPSQLKVVNALFGPSEEEVARAEAVVKAYQDAVASGHGVATHDGRMIDAASLRMARAILGHRRPAGAPARKKPGPVTADAVFAGGG